MVINPEGRLAMVSESATMNDQKDTNPKRPTLQIRAGKPAVKPEDASAPVEAAPATDATPAAAARALAAASAQPAHPSPAAEEASSSPAREAEVARPGRSWRRPGAQAAVLAVAV